MTPLRIQQLPSLVVNQIAAGEVIERPASVVKELLENSLDAGSSRVEIDLEGGGSELIRVVDDGCGIEPEDLALAFTSHATSKLKNADDLFRIQTLGFRGEALASIGGVAQVTLQSRPAARELGAELTCYGGELHPVRPWNGSPGTRIEVRHLFFNTPVRRKFLRAATTEMGHVSETCTRVCLTQTRTELSQGLHLVLRHQGRLVYEVPATSTLFDRIGVFFGHEVQGQLYTVEGRNGLAELFGYIADPACDRGQARMQYFFVNGRWIRDRSLGHAVQEAYRGLLMTGRYAVAFLFLRLPPDQVDVNVHPTKAEVRFRNASAMHQLVYTTVKSRLRQENLVPRLQVPSSPLPSKPVVPFVPSTLQSMGGPPWPKLAQAPDPPLPPELPFPALPAEVRVVVAPPPNTSQDPFRMQAERPSAPDKPITAEDPEAAESAQPMQQAQLSRSSALVETVKAIQLYDSYLVVETEAGMLVIDQHALHERILFEQFCARIREGRLQTQRLLIPEPMDLTQEAASRVLEVREELDALGLGVEDFGGGTVLLTCYPVLLGRRSPRLVFQAVVDQLLQHDRLPERAQLFNHLLSLMACHTAVRAGERLTPEEMSALVAQRALVDDTHHCPHGRPTALLFSRHELERQFRRVV